ncbi:MAG: outer membrane beta-barrel protein, partial [Pseudobdellovibrionaceae bacterium]
MRNLFLLAFCLAFAAPAYAVNAELGINYSYKKSAFDDMNNSEQQSATGSVSLYFWERVALELSYTNSLYVKKEKQPEFAGAFLRTTTQYTDVYGTDLIFVLADRKAVFQPYLKGGVAMVKVKQVVQDEGSAAWEILY